MNREGAITHRNDRTRGRTVRRLTVVGLVLVASAAFGADAFGSAKAIPKLSTSTVTWGALGQATDGLIYIAQEKGFARQQGITNLQRITISGGPQGVAAVESGSVDIAQSGLGPL